MAGKSVKKQLILIGKFSEVSRFLHEYEKKYIYVADLIRHLESLNTESPTLN